MPRRPSVALLIETSNGYARGLLEGIIDFVRARDPWQIWLPEQRRGEAPPDWLKRWHGDGIIARIETQEIADCLKRMRLPVVDVSAARSLTTVPWVETDDAAIARLAFDHFSERGFQRMAFVGEQQYNWSRYREEAFARQARAAGVSLAVYGSAVDRKTSARHSRKSHLLGDWLERLEKPVGVFCCYDIKAQQVLDLCRERSISVPEQIAVLGVDNDPLLCNLCTPALSSVVPDARRTGHLAAELLGRMLRGESVSAQPFFIPPLGVETRQSTDTLAVEDEHVAQSLRFIRERYRDGIDVSDLLKAVPVSRRSLEARFQRIIGRTPHEEILRIRLQLVRQLLVETKLSVAEIALQAGFQHSEYLSVVFKRCCGVTPTGFRIQHQSFKLRDPP